MVDWELKVTLFMLVWEMKGIHDKHSSLGLFPRLLLSLSIIHTCFSLNSWLKIVLSNLGMVADGNSIPQNGCVQEPHAC